MSVPRYTYNMHKICEKSNGEITMLQPQLQAAKVFVKKEIDVPYYGEMKSN